MNFVFENTPWEALLQKLQPNDTVSALELLTLLEPADEEETEIFLDSLAQKHIHIDISTLPKTKADAAAATRLQLEEKLVKQGSLLTSLEENDPLRLYLEEVAGIPVPACVDTPKTPAEKQCFTDAMLGQMVQLAQEYVGMGVLLLDLIQEANLGMWQGIQSYTEGDIRQHCIWWSRHYLCRGVLLQAKASGMGQRIRQAAEDFRAVDERLLTELGRNPTQQELADALHITLEETQTLAGMLDSARLLHRVKQPEQTQIPQEEDQAVEDTAYFQMRQRIQGLLSHLPEEDARLLIMRYGLDGDLPWPVEQVAASLGIPAEEVTAREAAALGKLRTIE